MAKKLPWFKFHCDEWLSGKISFESYELQGIFIKVCATYWKRDCDMSEKDFNKFIRNLPKKKIKELIDEEYIKIEKSQVIISFLDEQLEEQNKVQSAKSLGGKRSAEKRWGGNNNKSLSKSLITEGLRDPLRDPLRVPVTKSNYIEVEGDIEGEVEIEVEIEKKKPPLWKTSFEEYKTNCLENTTRLINDTAYVNKLQEMDKEIDIKKSLDNAMRKYWGTEIGWANKKKTKTTVINWETTYMKAISNGFNNIKQPYTQTSMNLPSRGAKKYVPLTLDN